MLLSINQIAFLLSPSYKTLRENIRAFETAFCRGVPTVREQISKTVGGSTQVDETQHVCSEFKDQEPPRGRDLPEEFTFKTFCYWIRHELEEQLRRQWKIKENGVGLPTSQPAACPLGGVNGSFRQLPSKLFCRSEA